MTINDDSTQWLDLVRKSRSGFFFFGFVVESTDYGARARQGRLRYGCAILLPIIPAVITTELSMGIPPEHGRMIAWCLSSLVFVAPLALFSVWVFLRVRRFEWFTNGDSLTFTFGLRPFLHQLQIARQGLEVILREENGQYLLALKAPGRTPNELPIVYGQSRVAIMSEYEQLGVALGARSEDGTIESIELPDGQRIHVSRAPLPAASTSNSSTVRVVIASPDLMTLIPKRYIYMGLIATAISVSSIAAGIHAIGHSIGGAMVCFGCGALFGFAGVYISFGDPFLPETAVDRHRRRIAVRSGPWWARSVRSIQFDDLAFIQLCSHNDSDASQGKVWQLNLVLSAPTVERICVMTASSEELIRSTSVALAECSCAPLVDHSTPSTSR